MCAAVGERSNVMHKSRKNISALFFAFLTERIPCQISITNPAPRATISFVLIVPACEAVIMPLHRLLVNVTIAAFSVCEIRAARHAAWSFRLSRHLHHLPSYRFHRIQKEHRRSCALKIYTSRQRNIKNRRNLCFAPLLPAEKPPRRAAVCRGYIGVGGIAAARCSQTVHTNSIAGFSAKKRK